MKRQNKWLPVFFVIIAIVMELYPKAVVVRRVATPEEIFRDYYSYFSMTPFWSENPYPLRAGICSCILLLLVLLKAWKGGKVLSLLALAAGVSAIILSVFAAKSQQGYTAGCRMGSIICFLLVISVVSIIVETLFYDKKP